MSSEEQTHHAMRLDVFQDKLQDFQRTFKESQAGTTAIPGLALFLIRELAMTFVVHPGIRHLNLCIRPEEGDALFSLVSFINRDADVWVEWETNREAAEELSSVLNGVRITTIYNDRAVSWSPGELCDTLFGRPEPENR